MKKVILSLALSLISLPAFAQFPVQHSVLFATNPLKTASNLSLTSGAFTLKVGTFAYANDSLLQAAALAGNLAGLNSNFTMLWSFEGTEMPLDELDPTNGEWGTLNGNSTLVAQYVADSTFFVGNATFNTKKIYAWIQLNSAPLEMAIFAGAPTTVFNLGTDEFNAVSVLTVAPSNPSFGSVIVGTDNTGSTGEYRLAVVPEPTTGLLIALGAGALALARRRRA